MRPRLRRAIAFAGYGGPALSGMIFTLAPATYLPTFYAEKKGLELAGVGLIFFIARLWDAIIDPLIGAWSDQPAGRFGRRKLWIAASVPALLVLTVLLFMPWFPVGPGYLLIVSLGWYTAYTAYHIPYLAWGVEVATEYQDRNILVGLREIAGLLGYFIAAGLVLWSQGGTHTNIEATLQTFTAAVLVIVPTATVAALLLVPDPPEAALGGASPLHPNQWRRNLAILRRNAPFLRLMSSVFLEMLGIGVFIAVLGLFVEHGLGLPGRFNILLFVVLLAAVLVVPVVVKLSGRFGKHRILIMGQGLYVVGFLSLYAVSAGSLTAALPSFAVIGVGFACFSVLPASIVADTVDYCALKHREWRPGLHIAASVFLSKLAFAAATGIGFGMLAMAGFNSSGGNSGYQLAALKAVALALPAVLLVGSALVLAGFPIDRRRHRIIRDRLDTVAARARAAEA